GVTQAALFQSNLVTAPIIRGFDRMCARVLKYQAGLVKMVWGQGEKQKFAPIIGDTGIDILKEHIDITLDEFDVIVEALPPIVQDRAKLEQIVMLAVQTGELPITDALAILLENDLTIAVRKFSRKYAMRQMMQAQQEQQQAQIDQQLQAQQIASQNQQAEGNRDLQLQLMQMKNRGSLERDTMKG